MRFVIVGYGRVGSRAATLLAEEGHEVTVVDVDPERLERAVAAGLDTQRGDGDDEDVLEAAGIERADAIGGFTPDLTVNFAACMVGTHHGCRTVLRIDEDYREEIYEKYAADVDEVIYPERLGAASAKTAMLGGTFSVVGDLAANLRLSVVTIGENSLAAGSRLSELDLPDGARIYAHGRPDEQLTIPLPGTELAAGDQVALIAERSLEEEVTAVLDGTAA